MGQENKLYKKINAAIEMSLKNKNLPTAPPLIVNTNLANCHLSLITVKLHTTLDCRVKIHTNAVSLARIAETNKNIKPLFEY